MHVHMLMMKTRFPTPPFSSFRQTPRWVLTYSKLNLTHPSVCVQLAPLLQTLPEQWWYQPEANPDASVPYLKAEPMTAVKVRQLLTANTASLRQLQCCGRDMRSP